MIEISAPPTAGRRLLSLDVLRGLTIAFMIMVNNNGGEQAWAQMHHAAWNGFTATDLNQFRGTRTVEQGAHEPVRLALLDANGPTGTFSNETTSIRRKRLRPIQSALAR